MIPILMHTEPIYTTAYYSKEAGSAIIACGCALINRLRLGDDGTTVKQDFFDSDAVRWQHLQPSDTVSTHPVLGSVKYWDVVVEGQPTLKDCAWSYVDAPDGSGLEKYRDHVTFKKKSSPHHIGDGIDYTGEAEGLHIWEDWFM